MEDQIEIVELEAPATDRDIPFDIELYGELSSDECWIELGVDVVGL